MGKRAAGFLIYRLVSSEIQYLLLKASYASFHWTPPKGKHLNFLLFKIFFSICYLLKDMSIPVKMTTLQPFEKREKKPATPNKI